MYRLQRYQDDVEQQSSLEAPHRSSWERRPTTTATAAATAAASLEPWKDLPEIHEDDNDNVFHRQVATTAPAAATSGNVVIAKSRNSNNNKQLQKKRQGDNNNNTTAPRMNIFSNFSQRQQQLRDGGGDNELPSHLSTQQQQELRQDDSLNQGQVERPTAASHNVMERPLFQQEEDEEEDTFEGYNNDREFAAATAVVAERVPSQSSSSGAVPAARAANNNSILEPSTSAIITATATPVVHPIITDTKPDDVDDKTVIANVFNVDDFRHNVQLEMIKKAAPAEPVDPTMTEIDSAEKEQLRWQTEQLRRKRRFRRRILYVLVSLVVIAVIVVVVVVVTTKKSPSTPVSVPTLAPTLAPTIVRNGSQPVAPPQYVPTDINTNNAQDTVVALIQGGQNHTLMAKYIEDTNLVDYLESIQLTVFAPMDSSWHLFFNSSNDASYAHYANLTYWMGHMKLLLQYHIVTQSSTLEYLFQVYELPTAAGISFTLTISQTDRTIGDNFASILTPNITASNGYIHVPDRVLLHHQFETSILASVVNTTRASTLQLQTLSQIIHSLPPHIQTLLESTLPTGLTLVAPVDTAFAAVNWTTTNNYNATNDGNVTQRLVLYHLMDMNLYNVLSSPTLVTTMSGHSLWLTDVQNDTFCNGVLVSKTEVVRNGDYDDGDMLSFFATVVLIQKLVPLTVTFHTVDNEIRHRVVAFVNDVLFPPNLEELLQITTDVTTNYKLTTFLNITTGLAQLGDLLSNTNENDLTLLAPLDVAFFQNTTTLPPSINRLLGGSAGWWLHLQNVMRHHFTTQTIPKKAGQYNISMLSGYDTSVNVESDGSVVTVDNVPTEPVANGPLRATNGLIYLLNGLLLPPWVNTTIVEILDQNPNELSKLASLIVAFTNVSSILNGAGPLTLLAPSNTAFAKLNNNNTNLTTVQLQSILLGHIIPNVNWYTAVSTSSHDGGGASSSSSSSVTTSVSSLNNNQSWAVTKKGNQTYVGGALITTSNILASNGVIHIIDSVLLL